jgi:hypothetical protein
VKTPDAMSNDDEAYAAELITALLHSTNGWIVDAIAVLSPEYRSVWAKKQILELLKSHLNSYSRGVCSVLFLRRRDFSSPHFLVRFYLFHVDKR